MNVSEFMSYEIMMASTVFVSVLTALLLLKVFISRQLKRLSQAGRLRFLSYPEQIVNATRLPFLLASCSRCHCLPRSRR
jgi:hypothetical protein